MLDILLGTVSTSLITWTEYILQLWRLVTKINSSKLAGLMLGFLTLKPSLRPEKNSYNEGTIAFEMNFCYFWSSQIEKSISCLKLKLQDSLQIKK